MVIFKRATEKHSIQDSSLYPKPSTDESDSLPTPNYGTVPDVETDIIEPSPDGGGDPTPPQVKDIKEGWKWYNQIIYFAYFPFTVWFIMIQEGLERFSFYGFRVLLPEYLRKKFNLNASQAISIISLFNYWCYVTPLAGGIVADSFLGKYWTILSLSIVYWLGLSIISVTAIEKIRRVIQLGGLLPGLFLVGLGSGGIKSSVASFSADQFDERKKSLLDSFFTVFYLSINIGSTVSVILTPFVVQKSQSYAVAFFIPVILLFIGTTVFSLGKIFYRQVATGGNLIVKAFKVFFVAFYNLFTPRYKGQHVESFLARAQHRYDIEFIRDMNDAISVCAHLPPIMIFFACSDLSQTTWIYQAQNMKRTFPLIGELSPDQFSFLNPVLILGLAPILDRIIYPLIGFVVKPTLLRRMYAGFILTAIGMSIGGILQILIDNNPNQIHVLWQVPQYFVMAVAELTIAISGMAFAYQESPVTIKAVMQAYFCLIISGGDLFDLAVINILNLIPIYKQNYKHSQAYVSFTFAGFSLIFFAAFLLINMRYKYKDERAKAREDEETKRLISSQSIQESVEDMEVSPS